MGIILARFRRKPTTYQQLEKLDTQINTIQEYGRTTEITQKKVAGRFMLVSVFVYVVTALIFYFYFLPKTLYEGIIHTLPLLAAPLVIISVRRVLTWWYNRKLKRNRVRLSTLREQRKKMLDKVMETETYKVATEILEKFAPDEVITRKSANASLASYDTSLALAKPGPAGLRFRGVAGTPGRASLGSVFDRTQTPNTALRFGKNQNLPVASTPMLNDMSLVTPNLTMQTPGRGLVRGILPRERTAFDKLVDYLVGDGPSNRDALICKQCCSHNGMALREEFEYLSFYCCYCHNFNPAKKQRPPAPKLGASRATPPRALQSTDSSESERNSDSESDAAARTVQTLETNDENQSTANVLNNIQPESSSVTTTENDNLSNEDEVEKMETSDIAEKTLEEIHEKD